MASIALKFAKSLSQALTGVSARQGGARPWPKEPINSIFNTHIKGVIINDKDEYSYYIPSSTPGGKGEQKKVPGLSLQVAYTTLNEQGNWDDWNGERITVPYNIEGIPTKKYKGSRGRDWSNREIAEGDFGRLFGQLQGLLDKTVEVDGSNFTDCLDLVATNFSNLTPESFPEFEVKTEYRKRKDSEGNERIDRHDFVQQAVAAGSADPDAVPVEEETPAEEATEEHTEEPVEEEQAEEPAEEPTAPPARRTATKPVAKPAAAPVNKKPAAPARRR